MLPVEAFKLLFALILLEHKVSQQFTSFAIFSANNAVTTKRGSSVCGVYKNEPDSFHEEKNKKQSET